MNTSFSDRYGLTERDIQTLFGIFDDFREVKNVYLYGSRAKGTHKPGSDIDLAIMDEDIPPETIRAVKAELEESNLPYYVDLTNFASLLHKELAEHIRRVGIPFYKREHDFSYSR